MHVVKFNPVSQLVADTVPPPKPARNYFPDWYKKAPAFHTKKPEIGEDSRANQSIKMCVPFMDALSSGYVQETWQDISIETKEVRPGSVEIRYNVPTEPNIMGIREEINMPLSDDFYPVEFTFHPAWIPELPKGWSMLYMTPFNRLDLPFQMLSGVVDNDAFTQSEEGSNMPFYVKKSFSGIIPKGTPIIQMIPIKRESWQAVPQEYSERKQRKMITLARQYFWGGYKKAFWNKKEYN